MGYLPPVKIGHEADGQPEQPRIGEFDNLKKRNGVLYADVLIYEKADVERLKKFRNCSVEIHYEDKEITALSFLGGSPPYHKMMSITDYNPKKVQGGWMFSNFPIFKFPIKRAGKEFSDVWIDDSIRNHNRIKLESESTKYNKLYSHSFSYKEVFEMPEEIPKTDGGEGNAEGEATLESIAQQVSAIAEQVQSLSNRVDGLENANTDEEQIDDEGGNEMADDNYSAYDNYSASDKAIIAMAKRVDELEAEITEQRKFKANISETMEFAELKDRVTKFSKEGKLLADPDVIAKSLSALPKEEQEARLKAIEDSNSFDEAILFSQSFAIGGVNNEPELPANIPKADFISFKKDHGDMFADDVEIIEHMSYDSKYQK